MDPANLQNRQAETQDRPIPFDSVGPSSTPVSRQPLTLGATQPPGQVPARGTGLGKPTKVQASPAAEGITGMKTFFAKLHEGSLRFLEEQVAGWLKEHPEVRIKATNVTVGDVQSKVTEPNLIVVIWY